MSGLGGLDRPGAPTSPGAWDERSEEWLEAEPHPRESGAGVTGTAAGVDEPSARVGGAEGSSARVGGADESSAGVGEVGESSGRVGGVGESSAGVRGVGESSAGVRGVGESSGRVAGVGDSSAGVGGADKSFTSAREPTAVGPRPASTRRTGADPVKALMHRHRDLCERAVDPLEIAAGLEAHGITDRTAARFLHRDVFSLAEEIYARVPRDSEKPPGGQPLTTPRARADWLLLTLLPGALCAAAVTALHLTHGQSRVIAAAVGALAVALALRAALARGPLAATDRTNPTATRTSWLIAYALLGDGLLRAAVTGGPDTLPTGAADGPWPFTTAPVLALTLSCAPAAWCAHLLAVRARRKLAASRGLEEFATSAKPLLLGIFALYLGALTALLTLTTTALDEPAAYPQTLTLGALLLLARLLTTHGFTHAPALVLTATASAEATALLTLFAARLPGCAWLATPVQALIDTWGTAAVPTIACGAGALTLLLHATRTLTRASAHMTRDQPW